MKITLTPGEVKEIVRTHIGFSRDAAFTLDIVTEYDTPIRSALRSALEQFPNFRSSEKISAIKRFRDLCPRVPDETRPGFDQCSVCLTDAKWAIENHETALANLSTIGSLR